MRSILNPPNPYSCAIINKSNRSYSRLPATSCYSLKLPVPSVCRHGIQYRTCHVKAMDEGFSSFDDWGDEGLVDYIIASSDGEESEGEVMLNSLSDIDLPTSRERFRPTNDSMTMAAHRFGMLRWGRKQSRIKYGVINNIVLVSFSTMLLLFVDWCAWRIVRLPLNPFYLTRPFCISAIIVACTGYVCVPLFRALKIRSVIRRRPARHFAKKGTPTMGGLFFIPVGIIVAEVLVGFSSIEVSAAAAVTVVFALIGLLNDMLSLAKIRDNGLSTWIRVLSEIGIGSLFSLWLNATKISSPYSMKMLVPLPGSLGLVFLGKRYLFLTSFCFVSMANGIDFTDGLDGLAGGTAALAFIGMSIAVLPICSDLAIFGASMAGACVGFLSHNRYKASVFMGDTGSLALGGALAAMASCTGMFFPLLISSGIFVLETISVIMQVSFFKATKYLGGYGRRLFKMAPFHHHLELYGVKEPYIVAGAYVLSSIFTLVAGYVGLVSA